MMALSVLRVSRCASSAIRVLAVQPRSIILQVQPMVQIQPQFARTYFNRERIGNRDVVGHGTNGTLIYADMLNFPMQAIRFKENTPEVLALREKEKGDWKLLTLEEKKALYRASFCQTYAEMLAPTGEWKCILTGILTFFTLALWFVTWIKTKVAPPLPASYSMEAKNAQLQRMLDLKVNPIEGLASKYDYENQRWKK